VGPIRPPSSAEKMHVFIMHGIITAMRYCFLSADNGGVWAYKATAQDVIPQRPCIYDLKFLDSNVEFGNMLRSLVTRQFSNQIVSF
jgi:hypothetical protein